MILIAFFAIVDLSFGISLRGKSAPAEEQQFVNRRGDITANRITGEVEGGVQDDLNELSDDEILEFSETLEGNKEIKKKPKHQSVNKTSKAHKNKT